MLTPSPLDNQRYPPELIINMLQLLTSHYMHIVPLVAAASIVYGATRDERPQFILAHIGRAALWMLMFLGFIMIVLSVLGWWIP
jgi:hypothetical protein